MAPRLSFVVPAHNESAVIERTLRSIHEAVRSLDVRVELIVVDDSSTDDTAARAALAGARVVRADVRHIAAARNAGAALATGDTLIFVDADTVIGGDVVRGVLDARASGAVGGGARVRFEGPVPAGWRVAERVFTFVYSRLARLAAGCFVFADAAVFRDIGGFDERYFASEEVWLSRALKRRGRFVILRQSVLTSARKLRTCSTGEIVGTLARVALRPSRARDRRALWLWYGDRRDDA
jgi:glycosyltransferase involved in cell wall biosynthesis